MPENEGTLLSKADIQVGAGTPVRKEVERWLDQQIPYENFAGRSDKMQGDVLGHVEATLAYFKTRMVALYDEWAQNQKTAKGESISAEYEDDVHIPETWDRLMAKCASYEEALFELDPPFAVEGAKEEMNPIQAIVVGSYIRRQLELAGYRQLIRPTAVDAELCGIACVKVQWDRVLEDVVERKIENVTRGNNLYLRDERRLRRDALVFDGARLEQIDPFRILIDLDSPQVQRCSYIGDRSEQYYHELAAKADLGLFDKDQVEKLRHRLDSNQDTFGGAYWNHTDFAEVARRSRSVTAPWMAGNYIPQLPRLAQKIMCVELWCLYDFKDGYEGVTHPDGRKVTGVQKVVITVAGNVLIQFRLNPFDKKFVPYGVCRMNSNGHEIMNIPPFSNVVTMNGHYDRYYSNVLRYADLAVSPYVVTSNDSNLPESLLDARPGTVFRGLASNFHEVKISDLPASAQYMIQFFRQQHEEKSGALRIFEQPQGTATEVERKVQEQNRLLRPGIRAIAEMWRQVSLIVYWISAQFSTQEQRFRLMGKAAKVLNQKFAIITPDLLQDDIDIRFYGADSMQTFTQKTTGMLQWINGFAALQPIMPDVDFQRIAAEVWEHQVGPENMQEIFHLPTPEYMLWTQGEENWQLMRGQPVEINDQDDHREHITDMVENGFWQRQKDPKIPDIVKDVEFRHFTAHMRALQQQAMQERQQMEEAQKNAQLQQMMQGTPGNGAPAAPGGMQAKPGAAQEGKPLNTQPGVTPGPTQDRTVARSGRQGIGMSQSAVTQQRQPA